MLSDDRIAEMMRDTWGCASIAPRHAEAFARAIEAEVRKDYEALIRQLVEALELPGTKNHQMLLQCAAAVRAGRAWLDGKPCAAEPAPAPNKRDPIPDFDDDTAATEARR